MSLSATVLSRVVGTVRPGRPLLRAGRGGGSRRSEGPHRAAHRGSARNANRAILRSESEGSLFLLRRRFLHVEITQKGLILFMRTELPETYRHLVAPRRSHSDIALWWQTW